MGMAQRWRTTLHRVRGAIAAAAMGGPVVLAQANFLPSLLESTSNYQAPFKHPGAGLAEATIRTSSTFVSRAVYPANEPFEDRHDVREIAPAAGGVGLGAISSSPSSSSSSSSSKVLLACVMDGHGGWQAAEYARKNLLETVAKELEHCPARADGSLDISRTPPSEVSGALLRAFARVDRAFLAAIRPAFELGFGDVAHVGCCAVVAALFPDAIVVANAGDCRAVLGRVAEGKPPAGAKAAAVLEDPSPLSSSPTPTVMPTLFTPGSDSVPPTTLGEWRASLKQRGLYFSAVPLSRDHNAREPYERSRLVKEHPGEADIVVCKPANVKACYVKGRLQPTRVLGDAYLKESEFNAPPGVGRQFGRHIKPPYTPPYVSSIPELVVERVDPSGIDAGSFVLLACDGVWDVLSNEEAVAFVAEAVTKAGGPAAASPKDLEGIAGQLKEHVLSRAAEYEGMSLEQLKSLRAGSGGKGGVSRREVHDDITAVVLFFGGGYKARATAIGPGVSSAEAQAAGNGAAVGSWKLW